VVLQHPGIATIVPGADVSATVRLVQPRLVLSGAAVCMAIDSCAAAVHTYPDLWAELFVNADSVGRSKLGAVPYAIEADAASQAAGALATRLTRPLILPVLAGTGNHWQTTGGSNPYPPTTGTDAKAFDIFINNLPGAVTPATAVSLGWRIDSVAFGY
jgi:hypothetical protein